MINKRIFINNTRKIIDTISDGLMLVGQQGTILMVNRAMERLTGYSANELVGSSCEVLNCDVCDKVRSESKDKWCKIFDVKSVKGKRCLLMRKDGSYVPAVKNACLVEDTDGTVFGAFEAFVDITEQDKKDRKIEELTKLLAEDKGFRGIVGNTLVMQRVFQLIERTAQSDAPVIIYGETGTGKELVARAIHEIGRRREGPFVQFNCAALNESLLDSELFGHTKGAFTGAYNHRIGRFEAASGGDIFLDEIGDIPMATQIKLLRVLETKKFERIGDNQPVRIDVRIISATNRNLLELVSLEKFRQDLFFRINVLPIYLPALRERKGDIPLLVNTFLKELNLRTGKAVSGVRPEVMNLFMEYGWPGNIRELKSALEYASVITNSEQIGIQNLPPYFQGSHYAQTGGRTLQALPKAAMSPSIDEGCDEKMALVEALRISEGNKTKAAEILGVHRMTVWNRMKKHGIKLGMIAETHAKADSPH